MNRNINKDREHGNRKRKKKREKKRNCIVKFRNKTKITLLLKLCIYVYVMLNDVWMAGNCSTLRKMFPSSVQKTVFHFELQNNYLWWYGEG